MPKRILVDTDPGVDDALALILALRSPELKVEAITTVAGNVPVEQATKNLFTILELLAPKPRPLVAKGAEGPLKKQLIAATAVHGEDGLGELFRYRNQDGSPRYPGPTVPPDLPNAVALLFELIDRYPQELTLITLGPLTNLARAILADPERMQKVREVISMGGAIGAPGNITPVAEFNMFTDPHAAQIVFDSGLPLTLLPLDATRKVQLTKELIEAEVRPLHDRLSQFICDATARVVEFAGKVEGAAGVILHDPLAVGVAIEPSLIKTRGLHVQVETEGHVTEGMTAADLRPIPAERKKPANLHVAFEVDAERFMSLFLERICRRSS